MIYVFVQFLLLALIAWPIGNLYFSPVGLLFIFIAFIIALLAIKANKPSNFNIRPEPKEAGKLITSGIYGYIRHPMYSSLFVGGLGLVFCQFSYWKIVAWVLLLLTLTLKARFEEKALAAHYPDYKNYQKNSNAFIPFFW